MTIEKAAEIIKACQTPHKYELFAYFELKFNPYVGVDERKEADWSTFFAELCGFAIVVWAEPE